MKKTIVASEIIEIIKKDLELDKEKPTVDLISLTKKIISKLDIKSLELKLKELKQKEQNRYNEEAIKLLENKIADLNKKERTAATVRS